jgi:integrase
MGRKAKGERILGPYLSRGKWVVLHARADGTRVSKTFERKSEAEKCAAEAREDLQVGNRTIDDALKAYATHLEEKGNKPVSRKETNRRLRVVFDDVDAELTSLTPKRAAKLYRALVDRAVGEDRKMSADSHRNYLAEAKTFLRWCVAQRWLGENPLEEVQGIGRRKHGKAQLRLDEARKLQAAALKLAEAGERWEKQGAAAVLMALLLGMRASEITQRRVRDVDDAGRLLWIPTSKTAAGKRVLEVPDVLRPILVDLTKLKGQDRPAEDPLLGQHWRDYVNEWTATICKLAKVPKVTAHGLRGTHASLAVDAGLSSHLVAAALGHESFATTARSYAKEEAQAGAAQRKRDRHLKALPGGRK